jgi:hypothetical protein
MPVSVDHSTLEIADACAADPRRDRGRKIFSGNSCGAADSDHFADHGLGMTENATATGPSSIVGQ